MTRLLKAMALTGLILGLLASMIRAQPGPRVQEEYLTEQQALEQLFGDDSTLEWVDIPLDESLRKRVETRLERRLFEKAFRVVRSRRGEELLGYAVVTEEIGKYRPITFVVGVTPRSKVSRVAVMVYREHVGNDVKRRRFLAQFDGKTAQDSLRLNRDVINISGATLSVRAVTRGTRKILHVVDELLLSKRPVASLQWQPVIWKEDHDQLGRAEPDRQRSARVAMGTLLEMTLYGPEAERSSAVTAAYAEVERLESLLSTFRPESELSRVNREAASQPVPVSSDTLACVRAALQWAEDSDGAFDPTRREGGYRQVRLDEEAGTIAFERAGLNLDLGGIGKGYALDRAAAVLEQHGIHQALLNFGGQILALDPPPGREGWIVAVRDPEQPESWLGGYRLQRGSISTSALYERAGHIVDPRTGEPVESFGSATVLAANATDADALSTAVSVLGAERSRVLFEGRASTSLLFVDEKGRQWQTGTATLVASACR